MGRSFTPTHRVEISDGKGFLPMSWDRHHGLPTNANLERFVLAYGKSLELGGVNGHVSLSLGHIPYPVKARIIRQKSQQVVAEWKAGMFQAW